MLINTDLHQRVVLDTHSLAWQPSPLAGVERRPLERWAAESGRATSIVRYAAGSAFKAHGHPAGEEILVLEGIFADEYGDYPAGTWLKNPAGSQHAPRSPEGCLLFVKLCYLTADEQTRLCIDTRNAAWQPGPAAGLSVLSLDRVGATQTLLQRWAAGSHLGVRQYPGGAEILVLEGTYHDESGAYPAGTSARGPSQPQCDLGPVRPDHARVRRRLGQRSE